MKKRPQIPKYAKETKSYLINGGGFSRRRISLISLKIVGGALAVVAPPLGALGCVIGPFARTSCVGGVVLVAGPLVPGGYSHVAHHGGLCGTHQHMGSFICYLLSAPQLCLHQEVGGQNARKTDKIILIYSKGSS